MKKRSVLAVLAAGVMALNIPVVQAAETAGETAPAAAGETASQLSDDIYDFQVMMEGNLYQFPMTYEELTAYGWELSSREDHEMVLGSNEYTMVSFVKGEYELYADMLNLGINENKITDCLVGGISVDTQYAEYDVTGLNLCLAKGITVGTSTLEEIKAAYGEPSDTYEGDLGTTMTYEIDYNQSVELYVAKESGCLAEVDVRNFEEPEGFDKGTVSTETPEIVTAYQVPAALGADMMEPVVEFCGDLYQLPCPVTALQANGWEITDTGGEEFVAGDSIVFLDMMRDNQTISITGHNMTPNAVMPENCFVTELDAASYDEQITLKLSGDITLGAEKSAMIAKAEEMGFTYEDDEDYLTIYADPQDEYSQYITFWFNKDESETAAASVTYRNELLETAE